MIDEFGNNVIFMKLPVNATSAMNCDGSYSIFINDQLSDEKRLESYLHELKHIFNKDFYKRYVQDIEFSAHAMDQTGGGL